MEFAHKGTLTRWIMDDIFRSYVQMQYDSLIGIAEGMKFIHDQGFIHRDLKPDNILVFKPFIPKITDFGETKVSSM